MYFAKLTRIIPFVGLTQVLCLVDVSLIASIVTVLKLVFLCEIVRISYTALFNSVSHVYILVSHIVTLFLVSRNGLFGGNMSDCVICYYPSEYAF